MSTFYVYKFTEIRLAYFSNIDINVYLCRFYLTTYYCYFQIYFNFIQHYFPKIGKVLKEKISRPFFFTCLLILPTIGTWNNIHFFYLATWRHLVSKFLTKTHQIFVKNQNLGLKS